MLCYVSITTHLCRNTNHAEQGYEIRFDGGKIDTETFNMQITNVEVFKNDKRYWNADAILLDTILLADGQTLIVKNLKIDGFVSSVDEVKVGSINVRNVTLDKYDHLLAGKIGSLLDHALDNAYLGIFDFLAPIERGAEYDTFRSIYGTDPRSADNLVIWETAILTELECEVEASVKHRRLHNQNKVRSTEKNRWG